MYLHKNGAHGFIEERQTAAQSPCSQRSIQPTERCWFKKEFFGNFPCCPGRIIRFIYFLRNSSLFIDLDPALHYSFRHKFAKLYPELGNGVNFPRTVHFLIDP